MLSFCKKTNDIIFYNTVTQIPKKIWDDLSCSKHLYFSNDYLISLEKNNTNITFYYLLLLTDYDKAIAFTTLQIIDFDVPHIADKTTNFLSFLKKIILQKRNTMKILISGNNLESGKHGIFIQQEQDNNV